MCRLAGNSMHAAAVGRLLVAAFFFCKLQAEPEPDV